MKSFSSSNIPDLKGDPMDYADLQYLYNLYEVERAYQCVPVRATTGQCVPRTESVDSFNR